MAGVFELAVAALGCGALSPSQEAGAPRMPTMPGDLAFATAQ